MSWLRRERQEVSWNYRALKRTINGETVYAIHEVYYDDEGKPNGWTAEPSWPQGETAEELAADFDAYQMARRRPMLEVVTGSDELQCLGVLVEI